MTIKIRTATIAETPEALLNDLRELVSDAELMLNHHPYDTEAENVCSMRRLVDSARARLVALCRISKTILTVGANRTDQAIRANPYPALALSLATGLLAGVLLARRSP